MSEVPLYRASPSVSRWTSITHPGVSITYTGVSITYPGVSINNAGVSNTHLGTGTFLADYSFVDIVGLLFKYVNFGMQRCKTHHLRRNADG